MRSLIVLALILLYGCPRTPADDEDRDAPSTRIGRACVALRANRCPEGAPLHDGRTCYEHLSSLGTRIVIPAECVGRATSTEDVRDCGGPNELRFRCVIRDGGT